MKLLQISIAVGIGISLAYIPMSTAITALVGFVLRGIRN